MDWVNQNRFRNWLIAVLLASNLLTVSLLWIQAIGRSGSQTEDRRPPASESLTLLQKVLDLDEQQRLQAGNILGAGREQTGTYNDRLSQLKARIAEETCADSLDSAIAGKLSREIGELQSGVEMIRCRYFHELYMLCTPPQREKLRPIVVEVFGRKPPAEETGEKAPTRGTPGTERLPETGREQKRIPRPAVEPREGPPSVEEKLVDYASRLHLTEDQVQRIRIVLLRSQREGEHLQERAQGGGTDLRAESEHIRTQEDRAVMEILRGDQKKEFERLSLHRRE